MFSTVNLPVKQTIQKIAREVRRHFNKYSIIPTLKHQDYKLSTNLEFDRTNRNFSKWNKLNTYNNIRIVSTDERKIESLMATSPVSNEECREFMTVFHKLVTDLTGRHTDIPEVNKRLGEVLEYNVPNGKNIKGLSVVATYKMLEKPENLTPGNIKLANILGWCVEMLMGYIIMVDDIMDYSETRRGNPCWHKKQGLHAVNDGVLINSGIYELLKKHFSSFPSYLPIIELFCDCTFKTALGQVLDITYMEKLELFTMDRYLTIVKYKTNYCVFRLPITSVIYLANIFDKKLHRQCESVLLEMGQLFQIQNDFLDCFGNSELIGKDSNQDIKNGKCSWLAVAALQIATSAQREIMRNHYGRSEEESVQAIRNLYEELNLPSIYTKCEEENFNLIRNHIQQLPKELPRDLLSKIMETLYKRKC